MYTANYEIKNNSVLIFKIKMIKNMQTNVPLNNVSFISRIYVDGLKEPTAVDYGRQAELDFNKQALLNEEEELKAEKAQIEEAQRNTDKEDHKDKNIFLYVKVSLAAIVVTILTGSAIGSASGRVLDQTQSPLLAILWVVIFAVLGFGLEAHADKLVKDRAKVDQAVAWLFVLCALLYLMSFASEFALSQGIELSGAAMGSFDHSFFFSAQILAEAFLTYGFVRKIKEWLIQMRTPTLTKEWQDWLERVDAIKDRLSEIKEEQASITKEQGEFQARIDGLRNFNAKISKILTQD